LLTKKEEELPKWENQVKLNALVSAYLVVIENLLQNNPVENPDKLREEWTQEHADMISALNEAESVRFFNNIKLLRIIFFHQINKSKF